MRIGEFEYTGTPNPVEDEVIAQTETALGVIFPEQVKQFLKRYNGVILGENEIGYIEPTSKEDNIDDAWEDTTGVRQVFDFGSSEVESISGVTKAQGFPPDIIAFARDAGGNYFCLDYRNKELAEPSITFCSLDTGRNDPFIPMAENFSAFLDMIQAEE